MMKILLAIILLSRNIFAAPPIDMTNIDGQVGNRKVLEKPLTEEDVTYTDGKANEKADATAPKILYDVVGKSKPGRSGKSLIALKKGESVKTLQTSKDKRWIAIQSFRKNHAKAWVPKSAVEIPKPKAIPEAPKVPKESEDSIPEDE